MNNKVLIIILMAVLGFASCGKENGSEQIPDKEPPAGIDFPEDDGAKRLPADGALALRDLLTAADPARTLAPGETKITEGEVHKMAIMSLNWGAFAKAVDSLQRILL